MKTYFKGKNILVTGAEGFVGSTLLRNLEEAGANVWGLSKTKNSGRLVKMNVLNFSKLNQFVKKNNISICYHLAGISLVELGQKDPYNTFKTNVTGTLNILEVARINNMKKVIIASTSHVYGDNKPPFKETDPAKPSRPYETSKTCSDLLAQSYADTFQLPVIIARFVNIYGPGDLHATRLIPKTMQSVLQGKSVQMWGGGATREYLYIGDAIDAYLKMAEMDMPLNEKNRIFNFGSHQKASVSEIINQIIKIGGKNIKIKKVKEERTLEVTSQYLSSEKAEKVLKWKPKTTLDEGLRKTFQWFEKQQTLF